jgi:hypothetical protein
MNLEAISASLAATREGLDAGHFSLELAERDGRLLLMIGAKPEACAECLVPKSLFLQMVRDEIAEGGLEVAAIEVVYPEDRVGERG